MKVSSTDPEKIYYVEQEKDSCNIIITMQHSAGCVYFSYRPFLYLIGLILIASGVALTWYGLKYQRRIIDALLRVVISTMCFFIFYRLHFFEILDDTQTNENGSFSVLLFAIAIPIIFLAQW